MDFRISHEQDGSAGIACLLGWVATLFVAAFPNRAGRGGAALWQAIAGGAADALISASVVRRRIRDAIASEAGMDLVLRSATMMLPALSLLFFMAAIRAPGESRVG